MQVITAVNAAFLAQQLKNGFADMKNWGNMV
jgi:hypothetical protein